MEKGICKGETAADSDYVELVCSGSLPLLTKEELCCRGIIQQILTWTMRSWGSFTSDTFSALVLKPARLRSIPLWDLEALFYQCLWDKLKFYYVLVYWPHHMEKECLWWVLVSQLKVGLVTVRTNSYHSWNKNLWHIIILQSKFPLMFVKIAGQYLTLLHSQLGNFQRTVKHLFIQC